MGYSKIVLKIYSIICTDYIFFLPILFLLCALLFNWLNAVTIFAIGLPFYGKKIFLIARTFRRDILYIYRLSQLIRASKKCEKQNISVWEIFRQNVLLHPKKQCFLYEDSIWTFEQVEEYSNRVANMFNSQGYKGGDTIALMMNNRPEFVCIWIGLSKLGIVTALINPNLKGKSLAHCIKIAKSKAVIYHEEFSSVLDEIHNTELEKFRFFEDSSSNSGADCTIGLYNFNYLLKHASSKLPSISHTFHYQDNLLYIYTSGTTGLPKAAIIRNSRYILGGMAAKYCCALKNDDIVYNCLPLCHTSGGCLAAGLSIICGITTVIKPKFSASKYFSDCNHYKATAAMYIGEMCRYILSGAKEGQETKHRLRIMIGNGLRPAIWARFKETFKVPHICEFYGATEGNVNMANMDDTLGAVGCIPSLIPASLYPIALVRVDMETGLPKRNSFGLCVRCPPGEPGMLVGLIEPKDPTRNYAGYVDKSESQKKVIHNVFSLGDSAFASGDILIMDELGYLYFKDRTGDTFRWKGENVSTCEVESVISSCTGLSDCIVYGVQVGDYEGRAGMATIVNVENSLDLLTFASKLDAQLAPYARPLFLRLVPSVNMTSTFKLRKVEVEKLGIDPEVSPPDHYLLFRKGNTFIPLTQALYNDILSGVVRI